MGIYDRDYYRNDPRSAFGTVGMWTVTTWLIVINLAVFVLDPVLTRIVGPVVYQVEQGGVRFQLEPMLQLQGWGHFSVALGVLHGQIWRFVTFQFLHAGLGHLLFNMIGLYFFGPMIEQFLGWRRYLAFYLLCGIAGPFGYMLLWAGGGVTPTALAVNAFIPLVGASAGIFGILIAAAQIAPNATVLIYGVLPMRLKVIAWLLLGVAVYTVFTAGHNAGGEAAHLGGAVIGWLLIRNPHWLNFVQPRRRSFRYR